MGIGKVAAVIGGVALYYTITGKPAHYPSTTERYPLPAELHVVSTSLPYETRDANINNTTNVPCKDLEKIVHTDQIDFSQDFVIQTDRYRLVKDDDWLPSRAIGHVASLPVRLIFWDWNMHWGLDAERSGAVLAMLEQRKDIKDITVRLNHNEAFYDWYRMMTEKDLRKRNPFLYRALVGTFTTLKYEIFAELGRGDYYNPLTKTAVLYSNVESVAAHEIGHHKDHARFNTDWVYGLSRVLPPVMLYQEWKASRNACSIMSKSDGWQFHRYLIPAFCTYVLATVAALFSRRRRIDEEE